MWFKFSNNDEADAPNVIIVDVLNGNNLKPDLLRRPTYYVQVKAIDDDDKCILEMRGLTETKVNCSYHFPYLAFTFSGRCFLIFFPSRVQLFCARFIPDCDFLYFFFFHVMVPLLLGVLADYF